MRKNSRQIELSALEPRVLFSGDEPPTPEITAGGDSHHTTLPAPHTVTMLRVPAMNSNAGAKATIYLDFDGDAGGKWGQFNVPITPAYDIDGNAGRFSGQELANINEIFQRVSEKFSPFNINVTTVDPGTFANGKALHVIIGAGGSWRGMVCGGISFVGSFVNSSPNSVYAFPDNLGGGNPKFVAEAVTHECGHAFGLEHQSEFSGNAKLEEYNPGTSNDAPIMGDSYYASRGLWWNGKSSDCTTQDDMSIIASSTNGFGYRPDDFGSALRNAKGTRFSNGKFTLKGTIGSSSDRDVFAINFMGGTLQIKLRSAGAGAMLDAKLRLYRADGSTVVATDGAGLSETITRNLPAGKYFAMVYGSGSYGNVGQYQLYAYSTAPSSAPPSSTFSTTRISPGDIDSIIG